MLKLRRVIATSLPPMRIEALPRKVDSWCWFSRELRPLVDAPTALTLTLRPRAKRAGHLRRLAQYVSQWLLREEALKAANALLGNLHHRLPLSAVWGAGTLSSSDGQQFGVQQSSLLASFYPRYFGYHDRAVSVYTHMSNQFSVFGTRVTPVDHVRHSTSSTACLRTTPFCAYASTSPTHMGFTEQVFALLYLLGYSFMPRLRDLADQQLYKPVRRMTYGCLDPMVPHTAEMELLREHWDTLARVAASL